MSAPRRIEVVELRGAGVLLDCSGPHVLRVLGARRVVALPPTVAPHAGGPAAEEVHRGVLDGLLFETNRTFLLPGTGPALAALVRWVSARPGWELLLVGHADRSGEDEYNRQLSHERAEAVSSFLRDDAAAWLTWYDAARGSKRWGTREDQHMLSALRDEAGAFYAGAVDGAAGAGTRAAVERFQRWSNAARGTALVVDGVAGPATRAALIAAYLAQDGTTLPAGVAVRAHGCGEWHPAVETADGQAEAANRRVEVFAFAGAVAPPPVDPCPPGGCAEHARWLARVVGAIDLRGPGDLTTLRVRLDIDPSLASSQDDAFRLFSSDGAWEQRRTIVDDLVPGDAWVDLAFEGLDPARSYSLEVDPGADGPPYLVFEDVPRAELARTPGVRAPRTEPLWYRLDGGA